MKIGIIGTGHLGSIHLQCLQSTPFDVVGFVDPNDDTALNTIRLYKLQRYKSEKDLFDEVDAVIISNPSSFHFSTAAHAIKNSKHIFIEKPACERASRIDELIKLSNGSGLIIQVGHVERYNPAYVASLPYLRNPKFIEVHRLATPNDRANDVSVIMDLMIHDLDILLSLIQSEVIEVRANGVSLLNSSLDIANARIEFGNGAVANLTASRISLKQMRKMRLFQQGAYISVDFLAPKCEVIKQRDKTKMNDMEFIIPPIMQTNAILSEQLEFFENISNRKNPLIGLPEAKKSIELAEQILDQIVNNGLDIN